MPRIPETDIERLKNEVSVERLIEAAGIALKKSGKDKLGLCPFHDDGEPSLVVTPAKNLWHCFGCQIGGGPIDWAMKFKGVSFRHAVELLKADPSLAAQGVSDTPIKRATVRSLPPPVAFDADDQALLNQTIGYYHETLKQSPEALAYLQARGLAHPDLIERFKLGYANRTLGLRLPEKNRAAGADIRARLQKIGIYRESGHEHFNGSLVVPVFDAAGDVTEVYGRKVRDDLRRGTPAHLYLPGPHRGVWNEAALATSPEIILCEALIDAMTFWCAGFTNVTAAYGVEGFTPDHVAALLRNGVTRVLIAYDRDDAGDKAAAKLAAQLMEHGIECYRIVFARGMDANATALHAGRAAADALGMAIRKAQWLGNGAAPRDPLLSLAARRNLPDAAPPAAPAPIAQTNVMAVHDEPAALPPPPLPASPLPAAPAAEPLPEVLDNTLRMAFGERHYRVRGLEKNTSPELLKINLLAAYGEHFHVDTFDLYAARSRAAFVTQAAFELKQSEEVIRADLGKVLMKLEAVQDERWRKTLEPAPVAGVAISDEDRSAALKLLNDPDVIDRIVADMEAAGITGESTNKLVGYLAATSRKLANPLAIVIRSSSAAGKTSLMDAVLAMMPDEEKIKYSAMTGQSLFYMGQANLKHKILALAEEEGASRASYALKLLQSEGELTMASTGKDAATGNLVTQEYRVEGPVMLFTTTTALDIDPELLNRCLVLTVDEGRQQTQAIHRLQRQRRTLQGLLVKQEKDYIVALHQNAQRLLRPLAVMNPYADRLTFPDNATRTRRDHEKYLTLIDTIALLHQYQRPVRSTRHRDRVIEYIEVTRKDIECANALAHEVLGRSLDELPPQTRALLRALCAMVDQIAAAQAIARNVVRFTRRAAREALELGDTQLRLHLDRLVEFEYVIARRDGPGGKFVYELAYDADGEGGRPHLPGLIDVDQLTAGSATTDKSRGQTGEVAGWSRADSGPVAGASRTNVSPVDKGVVSQIRRPAEKPHVSGETAPILSYPQSSPAA
ncbi:CHC2 zinc finger domain-containing protein [Duganella sp. HH101]|uniref:CHC2 zinc finger domain-containing protein n=1 Tax=Duganella sp. HH101 TaxID=1781066 RepID=UPI000874B9D2|nr:CHC2 zinc finger domain-containing protein [Duganella sp. HH101]OEZ96193.1 DNA primase [Duganella sp. HH101]